MGMGGTIAKAHNSAVNKADKTRVRVEIKGSNFLKRVKSLKIDEAIKASY